MRSPATKRFWECFDGLPPDIRRRAKKSFATWRENPRHPALHFKRVGATQPVYSVRVTRGWRALGVLEGDTLVWFWIGSHTDYERLITRL
jgi:hypothetical protein